MKPALWNYNLQPTIVEGRPDNIKITRPEDLALAQFYLEHQNEPVFRDGDTIIVAPDAQTRRGDRVFLLDANDGIRLAVLERQTATHLRLSTFRGEALEPQALKSLRLFARIIWAS